MIPIDKEAFIKEFDNRCRGECCCCLEATTSISGCKVIDEAPVIDAVTVVRCKDCRYSYTEELKISCQQGHLENRNIRFCKYELPTIRAVADMHFCSCGERKDDAV